MNIERVLFSPGKTGFFFDDQRAIKRGARHDGFTYKGEPATDGFHAIRQAGESVSIVLVLEDGQIAVGDAAAVQYSGAGGRDPLFLAESYLPSLRKEIGPMLEGRMLDGFRKAATWGESLRLNGRRLHTAIRYGLSQALLDAHAKSQHKLMMEVVCEEYGLPVIPERVPIFGQTGDDRYDGVDKMILKQADVLPHGLMNSVEEKLGRNGEKLAAYVDWLAGRIVELRRDESYLPEIHIDVYGNLGPIFGNDAQRIANYLMSLEEAAKGFRLYIEGPVDMEAKLPQIDVLASITSKLKEAGSAVGIVADEWCNTFEDIKDFTDARCCDMVQIKTPDLGGIHGVVDSVLYCKDRGMGAYQGGSCNETDISARACVHVAMAARPDRMLAKPGMGFDEGYMMVNNEMERTIRLLKSKGETG